MYGPRHALQLPPTLWKAVVRGHGRGGFGEVLRRRAGTGVWEEAGKKWTDDMAAETGGMKEAVVLRPRGSPTSVPAADWGRRLEGRISVS